MDNENLLEEIRFWEHQPWQGAIQVPGEVQEDLGESDRFPPTTKAGSHCISTRSIQRSAISSPKLLRKIFGKTCHEFVQQADVRRLLQVKQVAVMVLGLSTTSSLSSLSTPTPSTSSTQDVEGSIPDLQHQPNVRVRIDKSRGDPLRDPTDQATSTWESKRTTVESSWQVRGDPLLSIFYFRRHDAGRCCLGLWTSFQCHLVQVHLTARGHTKSNFKSQCKVRITSAAHRHAEKLWR